MFKSYLFLDLPFGLTPVFVFKGRGGICGEPDTEEPGTEIGGEPDAEEPDIEIGGGVEFTEIGEPVKGLPGTGTSTPLVDDPGR